MVCLMGVGRYEGGFAPTMRSAELPRLILMLASTPRYRLPLLHTLRELILRRVLCTATPSPRHDVVPAASITRRGYAKSVETISQMMRPAIR